MEQYNVTGMSCAACSARVEKAVKKIPGVTSCSVSLLTNSMGVEGTASSAAAVEAAATMPFIEKKIKIVSTIATMPPICVFTDNASSTVASAATKAATRSSVCSGWRCTKRRLTELSAITPIILTANSHP